MHNNRTVTVTGGRGDSKLRSLFEFILVGVCYIAFGLFNPIKIVILLHNYYENMSLPVLSDEKSLEIARILFGIDGAEIKTLGSCQDANFRIKSIGGHYYVLKVSCSIYSREEVEFQNDSLLHLNASQETRHLTLPKLVPLLDGSGYIGYVDIGNILHMVRALTYVEGSLLSDYQYLSSEALKGFGSFIAVTHTAFKSYQCSLDRRSTWDIKFAYENILSRGSILPDSRRMLLLSTAAEMAELVEKLSKEGLNSQIIHGDLAYYNVIAQPSVNGRPEVVGVIDFGDVTNSWIVGDLAIAIVPLFASDDKHCILQTLEVLSGYVSTAPPLTRVEAECLWPLIVLRSILLYAIVSQLLETDPDNDYNKKELLLDCAIMDKVLAVPFYAARAAVLSSLGFSLEPDVAGFIPIISPLDMFLPTNTDGSVTEVCSLDLSTTSPLYAQGNWLEGAREELTATLREAVARAMRGIGAPHAKPPRNIVMLPHGLPILALGGRPRSMHSSATVPNGTTFCVPPGTKILAPFPCRLAKIVDPVDRPTFKFLGAGFQKASIYSCCILTAASFCILINGPFTADGAALKKSEGGELAKGAVLGTVLKGDQSEPFAAIYVQIIPSGLHMAGAPNVARNSLETYAAPFIAPAFATADMAHIWSLVSPDLFCTQADRRSNADAALSTRYAYFASVQEHYYKTPPRVERGYREFLYDIHGRAYLDMVNNVAVLGHCHESTIAASLAQARLLNTNSRFIYSLLGKYCEKIVSTIPIEMREKGLLNRVFLVNSGSEATDLALRIARTVVTERRKKLQNAELNFGLLQPILTGLGELLSMSGASASTHFLHRDVICLTGGYHGVTTASDEVSTTLNDNPRSLETRAPWVHLVPMPNLYRGLHCLPSSQDDNAAENKSSCLEIDDLASKYAQYVEEKVTDLCAAGHPPAAFICEPLSGNAGGVELPKGYLPRVYEAVRSVGGLVIADEVQVGLGRLGRHFWGFLEHDVEPDIITMAKAAGNGHPLGFVVTSEAIATEFGAEGSFFSSAGGGPVSCAVGLAVLETIEAEQLQQNALSVGNYLHEKLCALARKYPDVIGTIHGHGLYQGVELVQDRLSKKPATAAAYAICERLLELGVICHNTGDYSNVLKVKPPLCFSTEDADFFTEALETALQGW